LRFLAGLLTAFLAISAQAQETGGTDLSRFTNITVGEYQVLAQGGETLGRQVNGYMNEMLNQYSRLFANWSLKEAARVIVFSNQKDFRTYSRVSANLTNESLAGYCHWKTDAGGNTFYELVTYEHDNLWRVLAHEGFHQFFGYELGDKAPIWMNEGLAQYFETSTVVKGKLQAGAVASDLLRAAQRWLRTGKAFPVDELLQMDTRTFYANAEISYPMSWALVYYLVNKDGDAFRNTRFRGYVYRLQHGNDPIASFQRSFGRVNKQWQKDFAEYIRALRPTQ